MTEPLLGCPDLREHLTQRGGEGRIGFPVGWRQHLASLDAALAALDSHYSIVQIKSKFGGLRFYFEPSITAAFDTRAQMGELVRAAEAATYTMCAMCGAHGGRYRSPAGYYDTLCPEHADATDLLYRQMAELLPQSSVGSPRATAVQALTPPDVLAHVHKRIDNS